MKILSIIVIFHFCHNLDLYSSDAVNKIDKDGAAKFIGIPEQVERNVTWEKVTVLSDNEPVNNQTDNKEFTMNKEEMVKALIDNAKTPWAEEDRDALMAMNEEKLQHLQEAAEERQEKPETPETPETPAEETPAEEKPTDNEKTVEQYIADLPPEAQEVYNAGRAALKREKEGYVTTIMENENNTFSKEFLMNKTAEELAGMAQLASTKPVTNTPKKPAMFLGQGDTPQVTNTGDHEPLGTPKMEDYMAKAS